MTGWRLGWIVYPEGNRESFEKLIQFNTSGAPEFLQHFGLNSLTELPPLNLERAEAENGHNETLKG